MGVPGVGIESSFRNPEDEVARFFQLRHKGHFMIYNLACEKSYDYAKFDDQVIAIGWPDHHAPPLHILFQLCQSLHSWLGADPKNVAAVHCKAGKVRFGSSQSNARLCVCFVSVLNPLSILVEICRAVLALSYQPTCCIAVCLLIPWRR